ncbi:GNAT family N-acetyltransferase [Pseudohalocynthiibacter aestuariivivens]|nr:GNAT family N-acetyltransferase [Pseudohalocynthiibacter aestuariivivens]QIE47147.1 GNAT family N-acetyltransferase [Pseudohalocynthiibacter aestuariivivens]
MIPVLSSAELILETPRLRLRPYALDDEDVARDVLCDPAVTRYVCDPKTPEQVAEAMSLITRRGAGGRIGMWCAERLDTGEKIGDGVLTPIPVEADDIEWEALVPDAYPDDQIEVGYMLKQSAWGQGYASEICTRLLRFAFEATTLDLVVACTDPENAASQRVLLKCGLRDCGMGRAYAEDVPWFEITRAEWQADQASNQ